MKFLLLFLFLPLSAFTQPKPTIARYLQTRTDSTYTFAKGLVTITAASVTVDGVVYAITSSAAEYTDPCTNDHWVQLNNGTMLVHYNSNWTLGSVFIGSKSYYFY